MDEPIRVRCLACGTRLELPPRSRYAACRKCGSEYLVSRQGGAYALQPVAPEELALTREVAAVEREGEMGCANTALSVLLGVVILFCVIGSVGRLVFNNTASCLIAWALAMAVLIPGAVIMLRNLERDSRRRARLLARQGPSAGVPPTGPPGDGGVRPGPGPADDAAGGPAPGY